MALRKKRVKKLKALKSLPLGVVACMATAARSHERCLMLAHRDPAKKQRCEAKFRSDMAACNRMLVT
jgi:hypothetical protein